MDYTKWCGVCENGRYSDKCLTCQGRGAIWGKAGEIVERKATDKFLDNLFQASYTDLEKNIWGMRNESGI